MESQVILANLFRFQPKCIQKHRYKNDEASLSSVYIVFIQYITGNWLKQVFKTIATLDSFCIINASKTKERSYI